MVPGSGVMKWGLCGRVVVELLTHSNRGVVHLNYQHAE